MIHYARVSFILIRLSVTVAVRNTVLGSSSQIMNIIVKDRQAESWQTALFKFFDNSIDAVILLSGNGSSMP